MTNSSEADPGRVLANRYRLDEVIGAGGMGRVWRGTDTLLDRPVAVKELTTPPNLPAHEVDVLRTRMLREARSAAQLSHPSIITVFDVAEEDGRPWIVMELVLGPSLGDLIRSDGALSAKRVADIGEQMAAGLAEAHARGIVHRDIKPGNVLIAGNDRAVLTDFGIAHLDGSTHLTSTGLLIGSPSYLAPEIAHGHSATPASDMWALGITLYQASEGTLPFDRPTPMATLTAIVTQDLPEPVNAGPLRPVLESLCEKRPEDRPSVSEVRTWLREIRDASDTPATAVAPAAAATGPAEGPVAAEARAESAAPVPAPPAPRPSGGGSGRRRGPLLLLALVLVLLVGGATTGVLVAVNRTGDPGAGLVGDSEQAAVEPSAEGGDGASEEAEPSAEPGSEPESASASEDADTEEEQDEEDDRWDHLVRHEDENGFAVDVPEDWEIDRSGVQVYFRNPDGGYLLVEYTDSPNPDAGDDWRAAEPGVRGNFPGYELVGIEDVDAEWADDYVSAADWEFTYDGRGGRMHGINRGFHTEERGYALFLVASNEHPDLNREMLDHMSHTFDPDA
ncbi:serine/threonine-protein kinase [Nocardiopsis tropica]|uniref:non-specific serine/threonine protein kinase n=1 Tax=Nocardiopsis tropica TaxID=109330 RepID=A0ABU7KID9_9ACTN|nr:serine/threonine-protein kinase [Nocardiopsis umidischolae]MEE2049066.1 serine/threonine-protein kinase [Nocardiopsis umidischolae]